MYIRLIDFSNTSLCFYTEIFFTHASQKLVTASTQLIASKEVNSYVGYRKGLNNKDL